MKAYHCTDAIKNLTVGKKIVLTPGGTNAHGFGVYFSNRPQWGYGNNCIVFNIPEDKYENSSAMYGYTHNINCHTLGMALQLQITSHQSVKKTYNYGGCEIKHYYAAKILNYIPVEISSELSCSLIEQQTPSTRAVKTIQSKLKPTFVKRIVGILLGIFCRIIYWHKKDNSRWKWYALSRFLLGTGGKFLVPQEIAEESRDAIRNWHWDANNCQEIRPDYHGNLFWIVGSFTIQKLLDKKIFYGEDIFDFHPQAGQGVQAQRYDDGRKVYSWSGGDGDPTQIVLNAFFTNLLWKFFKIIHLDFTLIRKTPTDDKYRWTFSNALWNTLGGKPFTSIVSVPFLKEDNENED